ncbi:hypothetical protein SAMN05192589_107105 [Paracidovorax valerianellae]|uniref:Uncharacterized protein n=1 Tax=Paracidovorax valerianellae TaxID=187868 RepID=A0A1G6VPU6_9BURK|nr:hypothetical protein [Paracidovorax valerianellae]SDD55608.1 hypothetical protein SAMN05192589_107105 [Paracidovorax valerianellae]
MKTTVTATGLNLIDADAERSAAGSYKARQANISILMAALIDGLDAHAARAAARPFDYGFSGDLYNVQRRLEEMVASLAGGEA